MIDLIALERDAARRRLAFLAHRRPDIGKDNVRSGSCLHNVLRQKELAALCLAALGEFQNRLMRLIQLRARNRNFHTGLETADNQ